MKESLTKRIFDFLLSSVGLILSFPLWLFISIAILIEDGGPIFICQKRIGKGGKLFNFIKFRSMKKESMNEEIPIQAKEDDPRVTKVGKLLRVTAMDELPQLLNIWKGDMSFVGPRALLHDEIEVSDEFQAPEKIPGYNKRISIRPGLTGVAQIYTSRDVSREEKFRYDNFYIDNRNFLLDIKLIIFSFIISFKRNWESRGKKV